ncbi:hypothetical protein E2320_009594 [Naja naja]|nr:hypothetical protein E2320_009594 [Naja naja]
MPFVRKFIELQTCVPLPYDFERYCINFVTIADNSRHQNTTYYTGKAVLEDSCPVWLAHHFIYPQAIVQPSMVIPTPVQSITSPYIDYTTASQAYSQFTTAAYDQYPYAPSPAAGFVGYGYTGAVPQPATAASLPIAAPTTFVQYPPTQLQPDRMQ